MRGSRTAAVILVSSAAVACGGNAPAARPQASAVSPSPVATPSPSPEPTLTVAADPLAHLTDRQLAGQRAIYSYAGRTPPASLLAKIKAGEVAGVIFFKPNIVSHTQIAKVIAELQAAGKRSPVHAPLLLMTDQEGGLVRRMTGAPGPSEKAIGESAHPAAESTAAGTGAGRNLRGVGMNVNLAPVLDVYRRPGDFADSAQRSYSTNPATVGTLGAAFIKAQQAQRVASTAKHFPGLGTASAKQNTDLATVTLPVSAATLRSVDERPYGPAIAAGAKLIMVSWAVYPALDPKRPAGLSAKVVQGELRGRLHFTGVTVTDAIEAKALAPYGSYAQRGVLAAGAGMDLILFSAQSTSQGIGGVTALSSALAARKLDRTAFQAAAARVLALRASLA